MALLLALRLHLRLLALAQIIVKLLLPDHRGIDTAALSALPTFPSLVLPSLAYASHRQTPFVLFGHSMGAWIAYEMVLVRLRASWNVYW